MQCTLYSCIKQSSVVLVECLECSIDEAIVILILLYQMLLDSITISSLYSLLINLQCNIVVSH